MVPGIPGDPVSALVGTATKALTGLAGAAGDGSSPATKEDVANVGRVLLSCILELGYACKLDLAQYIDDNRKAFQGAEWKQLLMF